MAVIEEVAGKAVFEASGRHPKECVCRGTGHLFTTRKDPLPGSTLFELVPCKAVKWTATIRVDYEVAVTVYANDRKEADTKLRSGDWDGTVIGEVKNWGDPMKVQQSA